MIYGLDSKYKENPDILPYSGRPDVIVEQMESNKILSDKIRGQYERMRQSIARAMESMERAYAQVRNTLSEPVVHEHAAILTNEGKQKDFDERVKAYEGAKAVEDLVCEYMAKRDKKDIHERSVLRRKPVGKDDWKPEYLGRADISENNRDNDIFKNDYVKKITGKLYDKGKELYDKLDKMYKKAEALYDRTKDKKESLYKRLETLGRTLYRRGEPYMQERAAYPNVIPLDAHRRKQPYERQDSYQRRRLYIGRVNSIDDLAA